MCATVQRFPALKLDADLVNALPEEGQHFVRDTLGGRWARLGDWEWSILKHMRDPEGVECILFCHARRPSADTMFAWAYCPARALYELYFLPYGGPFAVARTSAQVLEYVQTHGFEATLEQFVAYEKATAEL